MSLPDGKRINKKGMLWSCSQRSVNCRQWTGVGARSNASSAASPISYQNRYVCLCLSRQALLKAKICSSVAVSSAGGEIPVGGNAAAEAKGQIGGLTVFTRDLIGKAEYFPDEVVRFIAWVLGFIKFCPSRQLAFLTSNLGELPAFDR